MADGSVNRTFDLFRLAYELYETNHSKKCIMESLERKSEENLKWQDISVEARNKRFKKILQYVTRCCNIEGTCQHVALWKKVQKKESEFDNRFLIGAYLDENGAARITLNHYNCDGDLTDNYIDISLDIAMEKAREHLTECDE